MVVKLASPLLRALPVLEPLEFKIYLILDDSQNPANTASKPSLFEYPLQYIPARPSLLAPAKHCAEPCKHCVKTVPVSTSLLDPAITKDYYPNA
jgi:hypothetical protein